MDDKKLETEPCLNVKQNADATKPVQLLLYPERWWILASVSILQFANYGHWIAFGAVTKTTAVYYDQPGDKMDLVVLSSYVVSIPMCVVAILVVNWLGLRKTLNLSGLLTAIGECK